MSSGRSDRGSSRHSAGLLLRVGRADGHAEEVYLAPNLTIGRSVANSVVLADDESVDRTHARVEVADDGTARLRCVEPDGTMMADGVAVRELTLDAGVRFRIGRAEFECVSGRRGAEGEPQRSWSTCPFCGSAAVPTAGDGARPCPDCNNPVIPVTLDPHSPDPILVPAAYGPYRAERYVARGGMGVVFKGTREGGDEAVAVKVLLPGTILDRRDAGRFGQEVAMLERVRHPNVVKLLDHGTAGRCHYLVLEWVEGPSLREVIADANRAGKLTDFADASRWFEQVGKGLAAIHAVGMVHRDLKPSNILIDPNGVARVADLGIAKRIDAGHTSYTTTGHAPGTFEYMAPEQHGAPDTVDGRVDLYALGVTFYELLTGTRPVGAWRPASQANPTVPKRFDAILGRLLEPGPEHRYVDIYELLAATSAAKPGLLSGSGADSGHGGRRVEDERRGANQGVLVTCTNVLQSIGTIGNWLRAWSEPRVKAFRAKHASVERRARIGARNGAIWGMCLLGTLACLIGAPVSCLIAIVTGDAAVLRGAFSWIALAAAVGLLFGGTGGALWGAFIATDTIGPVGFRLALTQIFTPVRRMWRWFRQPKPRSEVLRQASRVPGGPNAAPQLQKDNPVLKFLGGVISAAIVIYVRTQIPYFNRDTRRPYLLPHHSQKQELMESQTKKRAAHPQQAISLLRRGQADQALAACNTVLAAGPPGGATQALAFSYRGLANAQKRNYDRALADSNKAIELAPTLAEVYANRGLVHGERDDYERALADCDKAILLDPKSALAYSCRAGVRIVRGDFEHAITDGEKAVSLDPNLPEAYIARGGAQIFRAEFDLAINDCNEAIRQEPAYVDAFIVRSLAHLLKGELDTAIADADKAIELNPGEAGGWLGRGWVNQLKGEPERAIADLSKAISLDPSDATAYTQRGLAYQGRSEPDHAITDFNRAITLDPKVADVYSDRGLAHLSKGDLDAAIADCSKAIELNPNLAEAYIWRGSAWNRKGQHDRAIEDLTKAITLDPSAALAYNNRGLTRLGKGELDLAIADFDQAVKHDPQLAWAYTLPRKFMPFVARNQNCRYS